jgi:anti-sigma B factor antagonist
MRVRKRMVGDVAVAALSGALDSESAAEIREKVAGLLPEHKHVVVDFSGVSCVSSASLRAMLLIYRQAQALDRTVAVVGLSPEVHNVLDATGFLDFFVVSESVADAVADVQGPRGGKELEHAAASAS